LNKACAALTVWEKEQINISGDIGELEALGIECRSVPLHHSQDAERIVTALSDADYVVAGSERFDGQTLPRLPKLKLIARLGVGYDSVDLAVAERCGVAACNLPGANGEVVAEHTLGMMLAVTHRLQQHTERIKRGKYDRGIFPARGSTCSRPSRCRMTVR
jgi:phosphoglycerate dehydrogenase-like enzyme